MTKENRARLIELLKIYREDLRDIENKGGNVEEMRNCAQMLQGHLELEEDLGVPVLWGLEFEE